MTCFIRFTLALGFILGVARLGAAGSMNMMDMKGEILAAYVKTSAALAADDFEAAKTAAAAVAGHAGMSDHKDIAEKAQAVAKADKIETARENFKALSAAVEPLAAGDKSVVVMHCPMADADWVQAKGKTQNPYYGKAMISCGSPKQTK